MDLRPKLVSERAGWGQAANHEFKKNLPADVVRGGHGDKGWQVVAQMGREIDLSTVVALGRWVGLADAAKPE